MANIEKRVSKDKEVTYRAKVRLKGAPPQSATFTRLTDAKKWVAATESAIREGRHFKTIEAKKHIFSELIDRYTNEVLPRKTPKLASNQKTQLAWFKNEIGTFLLSDVTPALIAQCRDKLLTESSFTGKPLSPASVVRYLSALSHVFKVAVNDWQWLEDSPMAKVRKPKEPRGRVRFLDESERACLLTACKHSKNNVLYLCVILALSTGMRQGELMNLTWPDIFLEQGFIILHQTKNGERRRVPISGHALDLLKEYYKTRNVDVELLFPGLIDPNKPIDLRSAFEHALKVAQVKDFKWHDLRHCTASYLAMNGATLAEIAEILGHKTLAMVRRYAHFSDGHVSNVVASMNSKIFGGG